MTIPLRKRGLRRSKLITPGDNYALMEKAARSEADTVHLEIEDGVPAERKPQARELMLKAMRELDFGKKEVWIRINHFNTNLTEADVDILTAGRPNLFFLGKAQGPEDMVGLDKLVTAAERKHGLPLGEIQIGAVIERIRAFTQVEQVAAASPRMGMLIFGIDDLANEYGYQTTRDPEGGPETLYIRSRIVLAARLAGIDCLDAPYQNIRDRDGCERDSRFSAKLGFTGKGVISPAQIEAVHAGFMPSQKEVVWATTIMEAVEKGRKENRELFIIDGLMIDRPHFAQAQRILRRIGTEWEPPPSAAELA